ncbi:glycosyltransferase family 4 protein [Aquimarina sp. 2201CG5-10]|uniref:glycosyltransferase family 4 protein n=1 Tax=Aquimarina callyspongiae TaxID=3098150 RepID=UPI002AB34352|nr:glycosyltransferase family 4 protein [Aquimarina sp. 2201CG5-10]MDY8136894.1 glycosyltransferase family 4 protein [Aquimarina sp. 2201CG5-10]
MKIIHIISTLNIGGAENFVVQLANQQVVDNEVLIVVTGITNTEENYINHIDDRIIVHQLQWLKKYSVKQFFQLNSLIGKLGPNQVFVHLHNPLYYIYGVSFLKPKLAYIHTIHSSFENWKPILKYLNKLRFINNKILHVCVAKSIYKQLKQSFPKLRSTYINNGIKSYHAQREPVQIKTFWNSFSIKPQIGQRFLAIGNINKHKNYKMLAQSFEQIHAKYPNSMCIHIGNEMDPILSDELKKINAPNVFLAGAKNNAADFLSEADALIVSSVQEGMPIVALEALSMGVPVITTPAGGLKDLIINEVNGYLIDDFKASSLTEAIIEYIRLSKDERKALSTNARVYFEQFYDISKVCETYQNKSA